MKPVRRSFDAAGDYIVPLSTYGEEAFSYASSIPVVLKPLVDKENPWSVIETIPSGTSGVYKNPADAVIVTTTGPTEFVLLQYGD